MRTYYGGMPKYLQVGEHQFVNDKLIELWINLMLLGWYTFCLLHMKIND
jgi:hypothetical protein